MCYIYYLHLVDEVVGADDIVLHVLVLVAIILHPRGLPGGRQTHHHDDLAKASHGL